MFSKHDHLCMAKALQLAKKGMCTTAPNPRVGCVISKNESVIGQGWHQRAGEAHAEVNAIDSVNGSLHGATVYVTLEPCSHHGRTPPCCEALVEQKVARVVVAMKDPNPQVAGRGIQYLERNGIRVDVGLSEAQARDLNPGFISRMSRGRPWVRVKLAVSIDGRTALQNGTSQWITGDEARRDVHRWRARADCILTGSGTVLADNPSMNVRLNIPGDTFVQPVRVIIDGDLKTPKTGNILTADGRVVIYSKEKTQKYNKIKDFSLVISEQNDQGKLNLRWVMEDLARAEINEVHVEAGAGLCGALLKVGLVDELVIYQAGIVLGSASRGMFDLPELVDMGEKIPFTLQDVRRIGNDVRTVFRLTNPSE